MKEFLETVDMSIKFNTRINDQFHPDIRTTLIFYADAEGIKAKKYNWENDLITDCDYMGKYK
jgi:hypothetical protein